MLKQKYFEIKNLGEYYGLHVQSNTLLLPDAFEKLPVNNFERIEDTSQFNEDFIKNYNEESDKRYFL